MEAHYKVYFTQNTDLADSYKIDKVDVDVVYGSWTSCTEDFTATVKTSLTYLESQYARINSGNPGYILGKPLLIGTLETYEETLSDGSIS